MNSLPWSSPAIAVSYQKALCYTKKLYAISESPTLLYQKAPCYTRKPYDLAVVVQIYAVALFVEAEPAAHELGIRHRGGFFQDNRCCILYILIALLTH